MPAYPDQPGNAYADRPLAGVTASPAYLTQLLNAVQHSVIAVDREERITYWNDYATRFYGFTREEALGGNIITVTVRAEDVDAARELLATVWQGRPWAGEFPVRHRNGRSVPARVKLFPVFEPDGTVSGIIGVGEDITAELALRADLLRGQERFELLTRSTSDAVWDWEAESGTLWGNAAYEALVGPRREEDSPRDVWFRRIHPDDQAAMRAQLEAADAGASSFRHEYRFLSYLTNAYVRILDRGVIVRDGSGRVVRAVGAMTDVSEIYEIERAYRASEDRFRLAFEESPLGVVIVDEAFRILQANGAYRRMLDYSPGAVLGRSILELTHPEDRESCEEAGLALFRAKQPFFRMEKRYVRRDGRVLWAAVTACLLPRRDGTAPVALVLIEDVTEQRRVRDELTAAKARAEAAVDAKMRFLAQISHEFRSPMNGVLGMLELLASGPLAAEQLENVQVAREAATSLLGMLEEVLDLTRLDQQRVTLRPGPYAPAQLLQDVVALYREKAAGKGIELTAFVEVDVPDWHVADGARIRQVLINLMENAMKFTSAGRVTIHVFGNDDTISFAISDTGVGIPEESVGLVFEAFSAISAQTSASVGGTGLGLAISRRLARLMGGDITVVSREGEGSTFTLFLPRAASEPTAATLPRPEAVSVTFPGRRVLVVEDNLINQRVAAGMLHRLQCAVDLASNGVEGLRMALEGNYDAVIMDAMMPVMDGFEATAELRRREGAGKRVPVIGLTALASEADRAHCLAAGMDDFLPKPTDFAKLAEVLGRWLSPG